MEPHEVLFEEVMVEYTHGGCPRTCPACGVASKFEIKGKKPVKVQCPNCDHEFMIQKYNKKYKPKRKELKMHYRNGREAKNGDKIVRLSGEGKIEAYGVLYGATPDGGNTCNGNIAVVQSANEYACLCDCLHIDDMAEILTEKGI